MNRTDWLEGERNRAAATSIQSRLDVERLSNVAPKDVQWLWPDRFPLGMLAVIPGDPTSGKSMLLIDMIARISKGRPWPDLKDEPNPAGDVLLFVSEDAIAQTVRPRIDNANGDPSRVFIVKGVRHPESDTLDPFTVQRDLWQLDSVLETPGRSFRLVALDTLDAFLGIEDANSKVDVQRALNELATLAERHNVAVIGVMHLRKSGTNDKALYRTLGSLGFVSAPRSVWSVSRDKGDRFRRLLTCVKLNIAPDPTGLAFTIEDPGVIHWQAEPVTMTADEALSMDRPTGSRTARDDASDWLLKTLAIGPMESKEIEAAGKREEISRSTLFRAKVDLGVRARKRPDGKWEWRLPEECQR